MLKIITILTLFYFLSSLALPERPLPLQLAEAASRRFYEAGGRQVKPCPRRPSKLGLDAHYEELHPTPTYSAKVEKQYLGNTNLKPQSLKENLENDQTVESLHADGKEYSNENAFRDDQVEKEEEYAQNANGNELNGSYNDGQNVHSLEDKLSATQNRLGYTQNDKDKLDEESYNDQLNDKLDSPDFKNSKELDRTQYSHENADNSVLLHDTSYENTNTQAKKLDETYETVKNDDDDDDHEKVEYYKDSDELDDEDTNDRNAEPSTELNTSNSESLQVDNQEFDDSLPESYNKLLTAVHHTSYYPNLANDKLDDDGVKNNKYFDFELSGESYEKRNKNTHNLNKLYDHDELNGENYKNKYYSGEDDSKSKEMRSNLKNEHKYVLYEGEKDTPESDELDSYLYEIKKHLAHSEELKKTLKEVSKKSKLYDGVLDKALDKVKQHKAFSEELNNRRHGDKSSEFDLSDPDSSSKQFDGKLGPQSGLNYEKYNTHDHDLLESNYHLTSALDSKEDSDEKNTFGEKYTKYNTQDHSSLESEQSNQKFLEKNSGDKNVEEYDEKCPSKQQYLPAQYDGDEATRRLLSDTEDSKLESIVSDSKSLEKLLALKPEDKKAVKFHTTKYSSPEEKESEDNDNESNLNSEQVSDETAGYDRRDINSDSSLLNPARGPGVTNLLASRLNFLNYKTVCYACSSDFDRTCFAPNKRTTVKYCLYGQDQCLTKTYTNPIDGHKVVLRDCGNTCIVQDPISHTVFNSCEVCTGDLCNGKEITPNGASINSQSLVLTGLVILAIKFIV